MSITNNVNIYISPFESFCDYYLFYVNQGDFQSRNIQGNMYVVLAKGGTPSEYILTNEIVTIIYEYVNSSGETILTDQYACTKATSIGNNVITFTIPNEVLLTTGSVNAQIKIYEDEYTLLNSTEFKFYVSQSLNISVYEDPQKVVIMTIESKGEYNSSTVYEKGNTVSYQGSTYLYIYPSSSYGHAPTNQTYWMKMSDAGARGSLTYSGTAITGTSTTPTAYATGIAAAIVNDRYQYNGLTEADIGNVYRCTTAGDASAALWVYDTNIRGETTLLQATDVSLGGVKAATKGVGDTLEVKIDAVSAKLYTTPYSLPQATESTLGAIKASEKTGTDTVEAKIDGASGKLYITPNTVATDSIWDAAGDLAVGTGANTASRLPIGVAGKVLKVNGTADGLSWETDNDTTYSTFTTTTDGLVPKTTTSNTTDYLRRDGSWATPPDTTYSDANTSAHGLAPQATAPASGVINVLGIANGETAYTNKAIFDSTAPSTQAFGDAASAGTAVISARRDHKHAMPAIVDDLTSTSATSALSANQGKILNEGKIDKSLFDANTIIYATTDNTPVALTVGEQTVVGRTTGGNIAALAIDSDLSSVSSNDDTIPSAKATKSALDAKQTIQTITVNSNESPALGTLANNTEYRCTDTTITTAPTMTFAAIASTAVEFACVVIYKASGATAPVVTNNSGYTLKYKGDEVASGTFTPVSGTTYRMSFLFDGIYLNCYIVGVA